MKASVTVAFTALFAAVAVCYYYYGLPVSKPEAPLVTSVDSKLLPFAADQPLKLIQIQRLSDRETITIERSGEQWYLRHPVNYLAEKQIAEGLATALRVSIRARRLTREKGWEEYGLLRPEMKIGVEAENSRGRRYLLFGDKSPVSEMIFARWEDEKDYFLLDARMKEAFNRSVYSLREKRIVRVPIKKTDRIHLETRKGNYEISLQDGRWYWTEPVASIGKKIDEEQIYRLLQMLYELHIKEFLDGRSVENRDLGFSPSQPYLQLWAGKQTCALRLGREVVDQDAYYGKMDGEKTLLLVSKTVMDKLFKLFDDLQLPEETPPVSEVKPAENSAEEKKEAGPVPSAGAKTSAEVGEQKKESAAVSAKAALEN